MVYTGSVNKMPARTTPDPPEATIPTAPAAPASGLEAAAAAAQAPGGLRVDGVDQTTAAAIQAMAAKLHAQV